MTSSPSITGRAGLCRITAPPQHRDKPQRFTHQHTAPATLRPHTLLTSHSDADGVTGSSLSGLTPVSTAVPAEGVGDVTGRASLFSPPVSTPSPQSSGRAPPQTPSSRGVLSLTAQGQKLSFKQLRAAGAHSQTGCEAQRESQAAVFPSSNRGRLL